MEEVLFLLVVVLIASLLQASTGYGFSIVAVPFLLMLYPSHMAVQVNMVLSLCLSGFMLFKIGKEVDRRLLVDLIKGSTIGLIPGILIYLYVNVHLLKMVVGAFILIFTVLLILKVTIRQSKNKDLFAGGISGMLATSIGVPGPPLLLYFSGAKIDKAVLRSTTLGYYLFIYLIGLVLQILFSGTSQKVWLTSAIALPTLIAGIFLGQILFRWMGAGTFRIITYVILFITGAYLLGTGL